VACVACSGEGAREREVQGASTIASSKPDQLSPKRESRAQLGRPRAAKVRGRTKGPVTPVAITAPTACDWTSPASGWADRVACGSLERRSGPHKLIEGGHIVGLDRRVADQVADADAFGWGPRKLARDAGALIVGDQVIVSYKGNEANTDYTPCSTVGPTDPCGPDLWDERVYGLRAYAWGGDRRLTLVWEYATDWTPPGINVLSQSWEPVFQPVIAGNFVYVQEGRGQISKIDRSTGLAVATYTSPQSTDLTYVMAPPAVAPDGTVYFTSSTLNAADPYTADGSWLTKVSPDGSKLVKNVNDVVADRPAQCRLFFSLSSPRPALPWPPAPGALAPSFNSGAWRFPVNATPAISLDGTKVTVVARARQCQDANAVVQLRTADLTKVWENNLRGWLDMGCGPQRSPSNQPTHYLTPDTALATDTGNNLDCRVGSTLGVDRKTGDVVGGGVNELSVSTPVAMPGGYTALGSYTNYNNEQGTTWIFAPDGTVYQTLNFGWNHNATALHNPADLDDVRVVVLDSHYDNGPFAVIANGLVSTLHRWAYTNTNNKICELSGDIVDCVVGTPPSAPGPGQSLKRVWKLINGYRLRDVPFVGGLFPLVPRAPVATGERNVWVTGTDGVVRLLDGRSGFELDAVQVASALSQSDVPMSLDARGQLYVVQNGELIVVGK
jgi:hypothetical protein